MAGYISKGWKEKKIEALKLNSADYYSEMAVTDEIKQDINWWTKTIPKASQCFMPKNFKTEIFTDSSLSGWEAAREDKKIYGIWDIN